MTMNERLEEIENSRYSILEVESDLKRDWDWLIEQVKEWKDIAKWQNDEKLKIEKHCLELEQQNQRYKQALGKIATRKMSQYLTVRDMNNDFIKIANKALEELK